MLVGGARLDAGGGVGVPLAVGVVVAGEVGANADVAVLADDGAGRRVELPFADGAGDTGTLAGDEATGADADVAGVVPCAIPVH